MQSACLLSLKDTQCVLVRHLNVNKTKRVYKENYIGIHKVNMTKIAIVTLGSVI